MLMIPSPLQCLFHSHRLSLINIGSSNHRRKTDKRKKGIMIESHISTPSFPVHIYYLKNSFCLFFFFFFMLFLSLSWNTESTLVITIFSHSPAWSPVVGMLRIFCQKPYLLIGEVNMFREIFIGLLRIQEWLWTRASGNQNDGGGRRESLARKQGLWLQGVKPVLTGLPDGRSCPGPPRHLLPWKGAAEAWDWQGAAEKKADSGVTVIAAGWGTGPSFLPREPPNPSLCNATKV